MTDADADAYTPAPSFARLPVTAPASTSAPPLTKNAPPCCALLPAATPPMTVTALADETYTAPPLVATLFVSVQSLMFHAFVPAPAVDVVSNASPPPLVDRHSDTFVADSVNNGSTTAPPYEAPPGPEDVSQPVSTDVCTLAAGSDSTAPAPNSVDHSAVL